MSAAIESVDFVFRGLAFVYGAMIGSFLNVVILRVPAGKSLWVRSACVCGAAIPWRYNVPIFGWFFLRGRARCCGRAISVRYILIELLTGILFLAVWWMYPPALAIVYSLAMFGAVAVAGIDLDTMEIPDRFSVGGFYLGVVASGVVPTMHVAEASLVGWYPYDAMVSICLALAGGFVGSGLILWIGLTGSLVLGKDAMGFGDVKIMGAIGAFVGWQGAVFAVFGGALLTALFFAPVWALLGCRSKPLPFGPGLVGAAVLYILGKPFLAGTHPWAF